MVERWIGVTMPNAFEKVRPMPDAEYAEYRVHHDVLADFYGDQQLYAIVELRAYLLTSDWCESPA